MSHFLPSYLQVPQLYFWYRRMVCKYVSTVLTLHNSWNMMLFLIHSTPQWGFIYFCLCSFDCIQFLESGRVGCSPECLLCMAQYLTALGNWNLGGDSPLGIKPVCANSSQLQLVFLCAIQNLYLLLCFRVCSLTFSSLYDDSSSRHEATVHKPYVTCCQQINIGPTSEETAIELGSSWTPVQYSDP